MSEVCRHCDYPKAGHWLANYSSGPQEGVAILVCPTAVFEAKEHTETVSEPRPQSSGTVLV